MNMIHRIVTDAEIFRLRPNPVNHVHPVQFGPSPSDYRIMKTAALLLLLTLTGAMGKLVTRTVDYQDGKGTPLQGYVVYDDTRSGPRPGVIIVHDWRGLTDYTKMRADMIAKLGYVAFAADIYGKGVHLNSVPEFSQEMAPYKADRNLYRLRTRAAYDAFVKQPEVDKSRIAAIGYCFGGTGVIEMARQGLPLKGVVSFHGGLDAQSPVNGTAPFPRILALCGADDPFEQAADMAAFEQQMHDSGIDLKVVEYPGAQHAFTDPGVDKWNLPGAKYNAAADKASWQAMKVFLHQIFARK
jgi:dienelactone hydrolase